MDRLTANSSRTDRPLLVLALVFLVAYAAPVI